MIVQDFQSGQPNMGKRREREGRRDMFGYFDGSMGDLRWGIELIDGTGALRKARKSKIGSKEYELLEFECHRGNLSN